MLYDFDTPAQRRATGSVKWDCVEQRFGERNLLPMWVADMDFCAPAPVVAALVSRAQHGIYGYTTCTAEFYDAAVAWARRRHNWRIDPEWIVFSPGIVPALNLLIQGLTRPGDKIIIQPPVYYPFMEAINNNQRRTLSSPLLLRSGSYAMDFDALESAVRDPDARLMLLCSPHNPVGRVWERKELLRLGALCHAHAVTVISDEIHSDLILQATPHVPFASLDEALRMQSVTCLSPSKTFNLAGLQTAYCVIPDRAKRAAFMQALRRSGISGPNAFGAVALAAAYQHGEEWLAQLLNYLRENLQFLKRFADQHLDRATVIEPGATYLVWIDFRRYGLAPEELNRLLVHTARVGLDEGPLFGAREGAGFQRINIACPRSILAEGLERIAGALQSL